MKVRTNYGGTEYVIPGKLYDVVYEDGWYAEVYLEGAEEDDPDCILLKRPCSHLNCQATWEIVEGE